MLIWKQLMLSKNLSLDLRFADVKLITSCATLLLSQARSRNTFSTKEKTVTNQFGQFPSRILSVFILLTLPYLPWQPEMSVIVEVNKLGGEAEVLTHLVHCQLYLAFWTQCCFSGILRCDSFCVNHRGYDNVTMVLRSDLKVLIWVSFVLYLLLSFAVENMMTSLVHSSRY